MTEAPKRIQLSRARGWRMPANTVKVDRTSMWGNWAAKRKGLEGQAAVDEFRRWVNEEASDAWKGRAAIDLRGKSLGCWCGLCERHKDGLPLGVRCDDCDPCHGGTLLEISNADET